ncbi:MAG: Xaa-Pro aminopeptidase [Thermoleophilaceae bacterium]|nr:Xaa-Pro aminopeptidase [Thermoleophilaceae bacterium]
MSALLIYGDTERSAALRHEVPVAIGDPFLFVQTDGAAPLIVTNPLEHERIARALPDAELVLMNDLGYLDMIRKGMARPKAELVVVVRAVARVGVREFAVPPELPVVVADRLRADGVTLTVDGDLFEARRRAKSPAELEGIRRAQRAAEAAMAAAAAVLRAASPVDGRLVSRVDGSPVTSEQVRAAAREAAAAAGAPAPADIMVTSVSSSGGHDPGSGPLPADLPVVVDLWPRDEQTGCWADMTRTFVRGAISEEVALLRDVVRDAIERVRAATRPGVTGLELYEIAASVVEEAGYPTQRTAAPGESLMQGFYFSLGHGVGLELHEEPGLGLSGTSPLVPGDVIAVEPGIEGLPGLGGVRYEDLLLVTESGCETLTDYPYELEP